MNHEKRVYSRRLIIFLQIVGIITITTALVLSTVNQVIPLIFAYINLVIGIVCLFASIIFTNRNDARACLIRYSIWCDPCGFDFMRYYFEYKGIWNVHKKNDENDQGKRFLEWKTNIAKEYSKLKNVEYFHQCLAKICRETEFENGILISIVIPVELAVIASFYGQGLFPPFVNIISTVIISIWLMVYLTVLTSQNELIKEFVSSILEIINRSN